MDEYQYGYPKQCTKCANLSESDLCLRVAPYHREGSKTRLMLVGQDPTIYQQPDRVKYVLMLNEENGH